MRGNLFAVTVDLVILTVRAGALSALLVRRGVPPFEGALGAARRLRPAATRTSRRGRAGAGRGDRADRRRPPPGAAGELRRARTATRAGGCVTVGLPRARARPARRRVAGSDAAASALAPDRGRRPRSPSTTTGSSPTASSAPAPSSSTPRWRRRSARPSSPWRSCAGSTRRCGAPGSTRATSSARSPARPASWCPPEPGHRGRGRPAQLFRRGPATAFHPPMLRADA